MPPGTLPGLYFFIPSKIFRQFYDFASLSRLCHAALCWSLFAAQSYNSMAYPCSLRAIPLPGSWPKAGLTLLLALLSSVKVHRNTEVYGVSQVTSAFWKREREISTTPYGGAFPAVTEA